MRNISVFKLQKCKSSSAEIVISFLINKKGWWKFTSKYDMIDITAWYYFIYSSPLLSSPFLSYHLLSSHLITFSKNFSTQFSWYKYIWTWKIESVEKERKEKNWLDLWWRTWRSASFSSKSFPGIPKETWALSFQILLSS